MDGEMDPTLQPPIFTDMVVDAVATPITTDAVKVNVCVPIGAPGFYYRTIPFIFGEEVVSN
jgi:hypothetical protein